MYSHVWGFLLFLLLRDEDVCLNINREYRETCVFHRLIHTVTIV